MSARVTRQIVQIDEALCDGCGACVAPCAEGAITIVDGKAHVVDEALCDGAGLCLAVCPTGALTVQERGVAAPDAVDTPVARQPERDGAVSAESRDDALPQVCFLCGMSEEDLPLIPVRTKGIDAWCCAKCLPTLIHG
jgi:ferredoxin